MIVLASRKALVLLPDIVGLLFDYLVEFFQGYAALLYSFPDFL